MTAHTAYVSLIVVPGAAGTVALLAMGRFVESLIFAMAALWAGLKWRPKPQVGRKTG